MYLAGPHLFTFWGIICGIVMLAPGHRNSVCMLEITFMQISALYVSMVRDSDLFPLYRLTRFPQMHAFWKNLKGTGNFIFNECCCEGQETYSRAVLFPRLHHVYVLSLAREKLMLKKTYLSNTTTNKEILFLIKTGKISGCPLSTREELFVPSSLGVDGCCTAAAWGASAIPTVPPPASPVGGKFSTFKTGGFCSF